MPPENLGTVVGGALQDGVLTVVVVDENPQPQRSTVARQMPWLDAGRVRMGPGVGHVVDAEVQVADFGVVAIRAGEVSAGNTAIEHAGRSRLDFPAEDVAVEVCGGLGVVGGHVDENQGVRHARNVAPMD